MKTDFSQPQRQSIVGVLIMFFDSVRQYAKAFWPIILVWVFKFKETQMVYFVLGILVFLIISGVIAYLKYLNFTFFLDHENQEFVITDGILNKTKTSIQISKIQQVNIKQSFIQKIIGVHALDVDTAGSNKKEVAIKAISHELALDLKARLLENNFDKIVSEDTLENTFTQQTEEYPFVKISFLSLVKVGITSNYIRSFLILLAFFVSAYENLKNVIGDESINEAQIDNYLNDNVLTQMIPVIVLLFFTIILAMNLIRIIFRYYGFKITKQKGSLLLSFGLLNTKATIIKPEKVQITTVSRNYFQKKMHILQIKIKQATSGEMEERKSAIEIPGCNEIERDEILKLLFHKIPEKGIALRPNFRKLVFAIFLSIIIPVAIYLVFRSFNYQQTSWDYFAVIYVVFIGLIQIYKFKNNKLFINENFIIKQSGAWDISNEIIEPSKIQAITTSQLFWHKKLNIGSVTLHTAGGNLAFQLGNYEQIREYVNLWLYKIETSDTNWM